MRRRCVARYCLPAENRAPVIESGISQFRASRTYAARMFPRLYRATILWTSKSARRVQQLQLALPHC